MSADNCLAILETSEGQFRVADIHMIWLGDADRLERLMSYAESFNFSEVFTDRDAADDYAEKLYDSSIDGGRFIEYGIEPYRIEMSWAEFYAQAQQRKLWRPIYNRCDLCHVHAQCRKFEECVVCLPCFGVVGGAVCATP